MTTNQEVKDRSIEYLEGMIDKKQERINKLLDKIEKMIEEKHCEKN